MAEKETRTTVNALLTVSKVENLSSNIIRICFSCDKSLESNPLWIGPHLKLLFADPAGHIAFPERDEQGHIVWQEGVRERVRTYSIRQYHQAKRELVVDFVIHSKGVATVWAQQAKVGEKVGLIGMGAKRTFDENALVLVGDISAMPTICYTLENAPKNQIITAFIEVNNNSDVISLPHNDNVKVNWIIRNKSKRVN